ncbi:hypothetical protein [Burkholderia cenocepacia]|uniref:hypothetical protein n=1 Tax=Burkholderia cenocepacia TaxID=95486 RepID=UPI002011ED5A|nr:hypothetical protein [Burkholderia cenocepacia]MDI9700449.1 hypothetical protein [Burkholderia cenocepacia]
MNAATCRHGAQADLLALTDGLSIARSAQTLRCCIRTVRNYVAGRSPIPRHCPEVLRLLVLEAHSTAHESAAACTRVNPPSLLRANIRAGRSAR